MMTMMMMMTMTMTMTMLLLLLLLIVGLLYTYPILKLTLFNSPNLWKLQQSLILNPSNSSMGFETHLPSPSPVGVGPWGMLNWRFPDTKLDHFCLPCVGDHYKTMYTRIQKKILKFSFPSALPIC